MTTELDPYLGTVVGDRYHILSKLGEGGMGTVYLAQHAIIGHTVAVKILGEEHVHTEVLWRFLQEARAAARVRHENIIEVFDFGETARGSVFFAMEYLQGQTLGQGLSGPEYLPLPRLFDVMGQLCRGLGAIHDQGIIHRDLKPDNILLIEGGGHGDLVKIVDFGIAKVTGHQLGGRRLTQDGTTVGTPAYMSPEQARAEVLDPRADLYSLGCILYEMLTGTVPFQKGDDLRVMLGHVRSPVEPPSRRADRPIPAALEAVCMRALEKDRDRRFQSAQEFERALLAAASSSEDVPLSIDCTAADREPSTETPGLSGQVTAVALPASQDRRGDSWGAWTLPARVRRPLGRLGRVVIAALLWLSAFSVPQPDVPVDRDRAPGPPVEMGGPSRPAVPAPAPKTEPEGQPPEPEPAGQPPEPEPAGQPPEPEPAGQPPGRPVERERDRACGPQCHRKAEIAGPRFEKRRRLPGTRRSTGRRVTAGRRGERG